MTRVLVGLLLGAAALTPQSLQQELAAGARQEDPAFSGFSAERGRAFFTTPETLGDYVLVDFIEHKKRLARGAGGRRAG